MMHLFWQSMSHFSCSWAGIKHFFTALGILIFTFGSSAQGYHCGTDNYNQRIKGQYPDFEFISKQIEQHTADFISGELPAGVRSVITIPVVFHIVYEFNLENISDAQVLSQLVVLNEDFRLRNQNFESNTPAVFKPLAADIEIEFCLAKTDPQGNPTNGITRRQTTEPNFSNQNDKLKFSNQGGVDAWPRDRYLNIWIADLESPLLGFAQFPGGPAATDGVVLHFKTIGKAPVNPYPAPYNLGKTASHEVGHWLNLFHTWGDEESGCEDSDQVADTPNQDKANFGCPGFPRITCNNGPNGDLYVNYMDYTDDICHTLFTHGQKQRMRASFAVGGFRASLMASTACFSGIEPESICADTLRYPFAGTYSLYVVNSPGSGYASGTNNYGDRAKAERFSASGQFRQLKGAWFDFAVAKQGTAPVGSMIQFKAWTNTGSGQSPGNEVASKSIPLSQIIADVAQQKSTQVIFDEPVNFGNGFFIGFQIDPNPGYELAIYTNLDGQSNPGTAWEQRSNGSWISYDDNNAWDIQVSHAIFPLIEVPNLLANASLSNNSICPGQGIVFQALDNASYYSWKFPGGLPAVSDSISPYVQYANPGVYSYELRVTSPCFKDTVSKIFENVIQVNNYPPTPFLEYDGTQLTSTVTTGSFKWYRNNSLIIGANKYFYIPLQNGIYRVSVTQSGCSSSSAPFDIEGVGLPDHSTFTNRYQIHPNPSNGLVRIEGELSGNAGNMAIGVYDFGGKRHFYARESANTNISIDLSFLESGIYLIELETGGYPEFHRVVILRE
jgi:hypothetical protein